MNDFFSKAVEQLEIEGYSMINILDSIAEDPILNAIIKFKGHPSINKIKEKFIVKEKLSFPETTEDDMETEIKWLDKNALHLIKIYNDTKENGNFPDSLKMADITPAYKKGETTETGNYRPVSILPSVSKISERHMYDQIYN